MIARQVISEKLGTYLISFRNDLSEIYNNLTYLQIVNTISSIGCVCRDCQSKALTCYNFLYMCKNSLQNLNYAIDSVKYSLENTIEEIEGYNSLFMCIDINDFTTQQYYDNKQPVNNTRSAVRRFCKLRVKKKLSLKEKNTDQKLSARVKKIGYDIPSILTSSLTYNGEETLQCKGCLKIFRNEQKFRSHYFRTHYPRHAKCSKCPKKFISEEFLKHHLDEHHSSLVCSQCGKNYSNKSVLKKHEMGHITKICCQECGRVYSSKEAFKKHKTDMVCQQKMRKTSQQAQYQCDICNKRYCYKPYLAKHIKYEHGNAQGFKCNYCHKKFYNPSNLQTHLVKHTQERKFECAICQGRFGTNAALLYHTRLHTGEKPYQCEHCDKAFLSASRRLDHVRRHHMEPTLECDICHCKFKVTGSLLKHKKRHLNPNSRLNNVQMHMG